MKTISILAALLAAVLSVPALGQQKQAPQFTISTVAGNGTAGFSGDGGQATNADLNGPIGVAVNATGNIYITDKFNQRIRKVTPDGMITTAAGTGVEGFGGDGGPALKAELDNPERASLDAAGNLYIADILNHRVRKLTPGGIITTVAGNGQTGNCGDGGPAVNACLGRPNDVVVDASGNLYISQGADNAVRKVDTSGIITTVAGNGVAGFSGDGKASTLASLNNPTGLTITASGDLFIADQLNYRIRKVDAQGIITTVAGTGQPGFSGDGGPAINATFALMGPPRSDAAGNIYIADSLNYRVRVLLTDGTIETVAGNGGTDNTGDGGSALRAALNPNCVDVAAGSVYIAGNNTIRKLTPVSLMPSISPGGVVSASAFGGFSTVAVGSFIEIYGSNLATNARGWSGADFNGINAPTSLDGTSVTIGGQSAFVSYISPGQVDALVPSTVPTGNQQVIVTNAVGASAPFSATVKEVQPGMLAPPSFMVNGTQYAAAFNPDGTYALPTGAIAGTASHPASPGDTIILYGTGFGPVNPSIPAGQLVQQANSLAANLQVSIGGVAATVSYAGLAPNETGVYQFNVVIPNVTSGNAVPLTFTLGGVNGTQALNIAVQ